MDASNVYGSDTILANKLRQFSGGQLLYDKIGKQQYCPQDPSKIINNQKQSEIFAFLAGN